MDKDKINNACPGASVCKLGDVLEKLKNKETVTALTDEQVSTLNAMCPGASACKLGTLVNAIIAGDDADTTNLADFKCPAEIAEALQEIIDASNDDDDDDDDNTDDSE